VKNELPERPSFFPFLLPPCLVSVKIRKKNKKNGFVYELEIMIEDIIINLLS